MHDIKQVETIHKLWINCAQKTAKSEILRINTGKKQGLEKVKALICLVFKKKNQPIVFGESSKVPLARGYIKKSPEKRETFLFWIK